MASLITFSQSSQYNLQMGPVVNADPHDGGVKKRNGGGRKGRTVNESPEGG